MPVASVVVDFDGTICPQDVSEEILEAFAPGEWWKIDLQFQRGEIGSRECLVRQAALLERQEADLLAFVLERFTIDPTHLPVLTNAFSLRERRPDLRFPHAHPFCQGCGTCKMRIVRTHRHVTGSVAFVGEGHPDRYGALYADLVFANKHLAEICRQAGVPFVEWRTFDDVRAGLETAPSRRGATNPAVCPGWTIPAESSGPDIAPK
jgi:2-hydroxy-3-keto-5-methylthiopentenyl-1-phosphate phosphatase